LSGPERIRIQRGLTLAYATNTPMLYRCACGKSVPGHDELCEECREKQQLDDHDSSSGTASSGSLILSRSFDFSKIPLRAPSHIATPSSLPVSQPGDPSEIEAEQMANIVMNMADDESEMAMSAEKDVHPLGRNGLHRQKSSGALQENREVASPLIHQVLQHESGQPLDSTVRARLEPRFGFDFSQVRIHSNERAAASASEVSALAYTVGSNIVFGAGQYRPETQSGMHLIAHELAHVVQNTTTSVQRLSRAACKPNPWRHQANIEHEMIAEDWVTKMAPGAGAIEFGIPLSSEEGQEGYADLVNLQTHELYEVKPNNKEAIAAGIEEIANYVGHANDHCDPKGSWSEGTKYPKTPHFIGMIGQDRLYAALMFPGVVIYQRYRPILQPFLVPVPEEGREPSKGRARKGGRSPAPANAPTLDVIEFILEILETLVGRAAEVLGAATDPDDPANKLIGLGIPENKAQEILMMLEMHTND
jgi:Domain of unknown function (DUF4157)